MHNRHILPMPAAALDFQRALLNWYDAARRDLPWRARPGEKADPYRVWLSEIMLQQTTVKAVIPYFEAFLARWPSVSLLAAASRDEVLAAWAGLGYYSRARNLYACAQAVARDGFPPGEAALRALPGVGAYTAAAIAAIAFDEPATVVDGNVERVIARLFALDQPLPAAKPAIRKLAAAITPAERPGDYAQAMMDLGATVCTPRAPSCLVCPARRYCIAGARGEAERFPMKSPKAAKPVRCGDAFVIVRKSSRDPHILLRRRKDKGLLGGMMEVPCSEWVTSAPLAGANPSPPIWPTNSPSPQPSPSKHAVACLPSYDAVPASGYGGRGSSPAAAAKSSPLPEGEGQGEGMYRWKEGRTVRHTFTHFHLEMRVLAAHHDAAFAAAEAFGGEWAALANLSAFALPAVMKKAVASGLEALGVEVPRVQPSSKAASRAASVSTVERSARPSTRAGRK